MNLLIYGAGGLAKEIYDIVLRSTPEKYKKIIFIDDFVEEAPFYLSQTIHFDSIKKDFPDTNSIEGIVGVGEPSYRELLATKFDKAGIRLATIIDKTALVSPTAQIKEGSIVCEYSTIHANVVVGRGCLLQPYCNLGHDIEIGDYSVISSSCAPGGASIFGRCVYMGMNSTSKEKITIGDDAIIAMGAAVFNDVAEGNTVIGNPARITKGNNEHKVFK